MKRLAFFLLCLLQATLSPLLRAEPAVWRDEPLDKARNRQVPVKVYYEASDHSPRPLVIFSHGLGGSREHYAFLGEHWAAQGYVAVFVQHPGSDDSVWKEASPDQRLAALKRAANVSAFLDRCSDIPFVLDCLQNWQAEAGHALQGRLDLKRIGLSGHSFGAVTTQALMGQRYPRAWRFADTRIRAFLLMSPSASLGLPPAEAFSGVSAPVLCMTGASDDSPIRPEETPASRLEVYASLPEGDKYLLVFEKGDHFAFSDLDFPGRHRQDHHHPVIQKLSTRFWDAYLKDDGAAKAWLQSQLGPRDIGLIAKDRWEWK